MPYSRLIKKFLYVDLKFKYEKNLLISSFRIIMLSNIIYLIRRHYEIIIFNIK